MGVTGMGVPVLLSEMCTAAEGTPLGTVLVGMDLAGSAVAEDICSNRFLLDAMLACCLACAKQNRILIPLNTT